MILNNILTLFTSTWYQSNETACFEDRKWLPIVRISFTHLLLSLPIKPLKITKRVRRTFCETFVGKAIDTTTCIDYMNRLRSGHTMDPNDHNVNNYKNHNRLMWCFKVFLSFYSYIIINPNSNGVCHFNAPGHGSGVQLSMWGASRHFECLVWKWHFLGWSSCAQMWLCLCWC